MGLWKQLSSLNVIDIFLIQIDQIQPYEIFLCRYGLYEFNIFLWMKPVCGEDKSHLNATGSFVFEVTPTPLSLSINGSKYSKIGWDQYVVSHSGANAL